MNNTCGINNFIYQILYKLHLSSRIKSSTFIGLKMSGGGGHQVVAGMK